MGFSLHLFQKPLFLAGLWLSLSSPGDLGDLWSLVGGSLRQQKLKNCNLTSQRTGARDEGLRVRAAS